MSRLGRLLGRLPASTWAVAFGINVLSATRGTALYRVSFAHRR